MNFLASNPKIGSFFKWWLSELADMLPNGKSKQIKSSQHSVNLIVTESGYQLKWESEEKVESATNKFLSDEALELYKQAIERNKKLNVKACNIFLHQKMLLNRVLTLPLATEENLQNVIAYEMDRYTPFKREDVYFDAQVQSRNKAEKKITVSLRVVKKKAMSELLKFIESSQLSIENIYCVDENLESIGGPLRFSDIINSSTATKSRSSANKYLLVLAGILTVIALAMPIAKNYWNAQKYNARFENVEQELVEAKELLSTYRNMKKNIDLSASLNSQNVKTIVLLNDLSTIISDDTSLNRLSVDEGVVRLQGTSLSASKLISALDSIQKFTDVKFTAPVTQNTATGNENFTIEMKLKTSEKNDAAVK
jgi:general secretion pathway protein L